MTKNTNEIEKSFSLMREIAELQALYWTILYSAGDDCCLCIHKGDEVIRKATVSMGMCKRLTSVIFEEITNKQREFDGIVQADMDLSWMDSNLRKDVLKLFPQLGNVEKDS